jgi:Uncharacterised nucleotidyltransferase
MACSAEDRVLLACAQVFGDAVADAEIEGALRERSLDWSYVLEASVRHAVSPLVAQGLARVAEGGAPVPPDVLEELDGMARAAASRNEGLFEVVEEIFEGLGEAGVEALALKELGLALEAYPERGLRPIGDLDVLIRSADYGAAAAALGRLGFEPLPSADIPLTLKYACAHHFRRQRDNVWVDLQWNVAQREWDLHGDGNFTFDPEVLWEEPRLVQVGGRTVPMPEPAAMLLHLCLHAEGHAYGELVLFSDIVALLGSSWGDSLDWQRLVRLAQRFQAEASVYYVLALVQRLLGAKPPTEVMEALEPSTFSGRLYQSVYGHVGQLHLILDEIRSAASAPGAAMLEAERVTREQAVASMALEREVRALLGSFFARGGAGAATAGTASERLWPTRSLEPFGDLSVTILRSDLPGMVGALGERGFVESGADRYVKDFELEPKDPLLAAASIRLRLEVVSRMELSANGDEPAAASKKALALRLVRDRLGASREPRPLAARIDLAALRPADTLAEAATELGAEREGHLFLLPGAMTLLAAIRRRGEAVDWSGLARRLSPSEIDAVRKGMALIQHVAPNDPVVASALDVLGLGEPPRIFTWARYGASSTRLYTAFKRPFYFLLAWRALPRPGARARYLLGALLGIGGAKPFLHKAVAELARGLASRGRAQSAYDLAYWLHPLEPATMRSSRKARAAVGRGLSQRDAVRSS